MLKKYFLVDNYTSLLYRNMWKSCKIRKSVNLCRWISNVTVWFAKALKIWSIFFSILELRVKFEILSPILNRINAIGTIIFVFFHFKNWQKTLKSKKSTEKRWFWGTSSESQPAFECQPVLRSRQKHIFLFIFRIFLFIPAVKSLKKV